MTVPGMPRQLTVAALARMRVRQPPHSGQCGNGKLAATLRNGHLWISPPQRLVAAEVGTEHLVRDDCPSFSLLAEGVQVAIVTADDEEAGRRWRARCRGTVPCAAT